MSVPEADPTGVAETATLAPQSDVQENAPGAHDPAAPAPAPEMVSVLLVTRTAPEERQPPSFTFFWIVAAVSAALDLASKAWASKRLTGLDPSLTTKKIVIVANYIDFQYAQNPGGAWSMLRGLPEIARRPFFLMVSTVASVFIASVYARIDRRQWAMRWGLPLALGGAVGNLVDRIRNGWVVDFVHIWWKRPRGDFHWPTFNVADVWIVAGVGLMAIDLVTSRRLRARFHEALDEAERTEQAS